MMNKAILEIDVPESCYKCKFKCGSTCEIAKCYGVLYHNNNVLPYYETRAKFCPLKIVSEQADVVILPCKAGDTVYVIAKCVNIQMRHDNDWETGTGAIECPFENQCKFHDCDDEQKQILETIRS